MNRQMTMSPAQKERRKQLEDSLNRRYGKLKAEAGRGRGPGGRGGFRRKSEKPGHTRETLLRLFRYVMIEKWRVAAALVCVLISTLSALAASYMLRPLINTYIAPLDGRRGDPAGLLRALGLMLIVYLAGVFSNWIQSRLLTKIGQNSLKRLRKDLFDRLQDLPVSYYDTNSRGDLLSRFTNDVDNVGNMLSSTLISLFSAVLTLAGTLALMIYTNVILTVVTLAVIPLMMLGVMKIAGIASRAFSRQQSSLGALNGYIEESITGQKVIKVFSHEDTAKEEFGILNDKLRENQLKAQFFGGLMGPFSNFSNQISYTLTAVIGGMLCILRGFDIGGLTVFLNYSRQFGRPVNEISQTMTSVFSALAGAERVFAVMDAAPETPDAADAFVPSPMKGDVRFEHVYFGYTPERYVLKDISLYAKPGQKIAFVGSTGAGKTTVTNLVNRFYDIQEGSITIDGIDIRRYQRDELRRNITMVLQETHLFTGTIMENIRYGRPDATDQEVRAAAKAASADQFIRRLPKGYHTMIDGDGSNLSQGQRQLLNIARAAVSKAPVLILDEATSSVDTRTEKLIEQGMEHLMADRTTFIIAHRLSTVRNCNAIMVLEHGEIIERGTHEDLLALKGRYYELYTGKAELD